MNTSAPRTRPAAVAGTFYPGDAATLAAEVDALLDAAPVWTGDAPKALVVPHAGYVYSGPIAASGYATLRSARGRVQRVVLLGPAHFVPVRGLAAPSVDAFSTPLGDVRVDSEARSAALELPGVLVDDAAHAREHSLEVHLPFLQRVLGADVTIVPFVVGRAAPEVVAAVLDLLWGGDETIVVVSSDLSHYLDHTTASARDRRTADMIVTGDLDALAPDDACGAYPVRGLLVAAGRHGLHTTMLDLRNSGDTAGSHDRVVGYGAFALAAA
jgi:AmmeMemoRadiSam system protein B